MKEFSTFADGYDCRECEGYEKENKALQDRIDELQTKLDKAVEALGFYAVIACPLPRQLKDNEPCNIDFNNFYERGGRRARQALKEIGEK